MSRLALRQFIEKTNAPVNDGPEFTALSAIPECTCLVIQNNTPPFFVTGLFASREKVCRSIAKVLRCAAQADRDPVPAA